MQKLYLVWMISAMACSGQHPQEKMLPGAWQTEKYVPLLIGKKVAFTVNHSSQIDGTPLLDTLKKTGVAISKVFTPEHGFTGTISDGVVIDYTTNEFPYELISLYGENKKPTAKQMEGIEVMVFDLQDVGTRFYTYLSTMHYVMEACAEHNVPFIVLDRPNPNGSYVDGPVLDTAFRSFVGMHPIPIVHGMTLGELARMINGEGWLEGRRTCELTVIPIDNWNHALPYSLPVKPSPNLPDDLSISLYPSLCLLEGTIMSVGRGTAYAFQQIGHPDYPDTSHFFTPSSMEGAKQPPFEGQRCYGRSWIGSDPEYSFTLTPLISAYKKMDSPLFFNDYFKLLAGTDKLQRQIESGMTEAEIKVTWQSDLEIFREKRARYLIYQ